MEEFKGIYVEGTIKTPQVEFNHQTGELVLSGRSIPENAAKVYDPILDWTEIYIKSPKKITNLHLNLEYFNSSSFVWITKIIISLSKIESSDAVLYIHFYFDIEDFEEGITDELEDIIGILTDKVHNAKVSLGIKTHGIDSEGRILKESIILI